MKHKRVVAKNSVGEVLLVGCEGAGKTLLCRHLHKIAKGDSAALQAATQPSIGVEFVDLQHPQRSHSFTLREVGGMMQPVWSRYFEECSALILMADSATVEGLSCAAVELYNVLGSQALSSKRILLLLNQRDRDGALPEPSAQMLIGLPALRATNQAVAERLQVLPVSALSGEKLTDVLDWCVDSCLDFRQQAALAAEAARAAEAAKVAQSKAEVRNTKTAAKAFVKAEKAAAAAQVQAERAAAKEEAKTSRRAAAGTRQPRLRFWRRRQKAPLPEI